MAMKPKYGGKIEVVNLRDIRRGLCKGRANQSADMAHVSHLRKLLEQGVEFATAIVVTSDFVAVTGEHRSEAKNQYFDNNQTPNEQRTIVAEVLPLVWDNATDDEKAELDIIAWADNVHPNGKAAGEKDLRGLVGKLLDFGFSIKQIVEKLSGSATEGQVKYAVSEYKKYVNILAVTHAQGLVTDWSNKRQIQKANLAASLPPDYDLPEPGETKRKDRLHKIKADAKALATKWSKFAGVRIDEYRASGRGQQALVDVATTYQASSDILKRKADSIQAQINGAISERALRERR